MWRRGSSVDKLMVVPELSTGFFDDVAYRGVGVPKTAHSRQSKDEFSRVGLPMLLAATKAYGDAHARLALADAGAFGGF